MKIPIMLDKIAYKLGKAKKVRVDSLDGETDVWLDNEKHPWREVRPIIGIGKDASPGEVAYGLKTAQEGYRKILRTYQCD